jgi:hypothetical protein
MRIFTRTACLGGWVTQALLGHNQEYHNQQKVRVDMFLDVVNGVYSKTKFNELDKILTRRDMGGVYHQSEKLEWLSSGKPELIIMDNYSELTDKKFVHKSENWMFCGLFGDFDMNACTEIFRCDGLLEIDKIHNSYDAFFKYVRSRWDVPIIFMHFPTTFDSRERYIEQGKAITEALAQLAPTYGIQNIHADADAIEQLDADTYHFTTKTVQNMASKIRL